MTVEEWRRLVAGWRSGQSVLVNVGELSALLDEHEKALREIERVEAWLRTDAQCSDNMRRSVYPPKGAVSKKE